MKFFMTSALTVSCLLFSLNGKAQSLKDSLNASGMKVGLLSTTGANTVAAAGSALVPVAVIPGGLLIGAGFLTSLSAINLYESEDEKGMKQEIAQEIVLMQEEYLQSNQVTLKKYTLISSLLEEANSNKEAMELMKIEAQTANLSVEDYFILSLQQLIAK